MSRLGGQVSRKIHQGTAKNASEPVVFQYTRLPLRARFQPYLARGARYSVCFSGAIVQPHRLEFPAPAFEKTDRAVAAEEDCHLAILGAPLLRSGEEFLGMPQKRIHKALIVSATESLNRIVRLKFQAAVSKRSFRRPSAWRKPFLSSE